MTTWLLIALGGALGAVLRFVVDGELKRRHASWPLPTFAINVVGSFVLGYVAGTHPSASLSAFVVTGLCGGFTTFSTASVETLTLLRDRRPTVALAYAAGSALACVLAVVLGDALSG